MTRTENPQNARNGAGKFSACASTVGTLKALENEIYNEYGATCKPVGKTWLFMALDLARMIAEEIDPDAITAEDLEELTESNFHTARHAAEVVKQLNNYVIKQ